MREKMEIVAATRNKNKLLELRTVAQRYDIEVISPASWGEAKAFGPMPEVEETGLTYRENALLKARAFSRWGNCVALGDDSGLEVIALGNRPGVLSARYAGEGASDDALIKKLLGELEELEQNCGKVDRTAFFRCSLALVSPDGGVVCADASIEGVVLSEPRGHNGFGYDPIILISSLGKTLAEVDFSVTCSEGFRAKAAEILFSELCGGQ